MVRGARGKTRRRLYVREWRESFGDDVSVPELALLLAITRTSYYRLEKAPQTMSALELDILADAFGIHPAQFWRHPDDPIRALK
jgi:hypothetical protein